MLTTGELLKTEREKNHLSFEEVEKTTRIRKKYLIAIEEGSWDLFPSKTYILGVIKSYGNFLKLDGEKLSAFFRREYEKKEDIRFKKRVPAYALTPTDKRIFKLIMTVIILVFVLYFGYQLKLFFSPPKVEILEPKDEKTKIFQEKFTVLGKTEKEATVFVNGERVYQDANNIFRLSIPATIPKTKVLIEVTGANGKKTVVKKEYLTEKR